jgi:hypothetical protein
MLRSLLAFVASSFLVVVSASAADKLVVHEWGTFTSLEDENGKPIGGINTDDEPLPSFVHDLHRLIGGPSEVPAILFKGVPRCDPDVLVRLETPVIYFHLPAHGPKSIKLDLDVTFHGGWLTQYYPDADVSAPGIERMDQDGRFGQLTSTTNGTLAWHGLTIGSEIPGPVTKAPVWVAPRNVAAAGVTTAKGESERFLFYRGVGNLAPPVEVSRSTDGAMLQIHARSPEALRHLWLVDVTTDGRCAMRPLGTVSAKGGDHLMTPATFAGSDYTADNVAAIRQALKTEIVNDGLFDDEADALLNTWEASYFRRPGLRLFFMVPDAWRDQVLPLHLSVDADVKRVMVGRIEIVTPTQRALLAAIAHGPASDPGTWLAAALKKAGGRGEDYYREEWYQQLMSGEKSLQSLHIDMPDDYRAYLQLGRFRNAMILDEAHRRPTVALTQFMKNYRLQPDAN